LLHKYPGATSREKSVAKKKVSSKKSPPPAETAITQRKRDRVASILAILIGLLSIREGGAVLLGVTVPDYPVLTWLVWYNVALGFVSVVAGIGMWIKRYWSRTLALNILVFHAVVFAGLFALYQFGQTVAHRSIFAMMFRTFTWIVIYSLLEWKRQEEGGK
jgi:cation transport ATPase